jgi:hypothetical protein
MPFAGHESDLMHVRRGLSMSNKLINAFGGTYQAPSTNLATWQAANNAKDVPATVHESDRQIVRRANAYGAQLHAANIYNNADIAASNDAATWRGRFTAQDGNLPPAYESGFGDD